MPVSPDETPVALKRRARRINRELAELYPTAHCTGYRHDNGDEEQCSWAPGRSLAPLNGRELKALATRHAEQTGHVVQIDQITRTLVGSSDPRDDADEREG